MTCQKRIFPALFMKSEVIITFPSNVRMNMLQIKPVGIRRGTNQFSQLSQLFRWIVNDIRPSLSVVVIQSLSKLKWKKEISHNTWTIREKGTKYCLFPQQTQARYPGTPLPIWQCNVLTSANMDDVTERVVVSFCYPVSVFKQSDLIHLNVIVG